MTEQRRPSLHIVPDPKPEPVLEKPVDGPMCKECGVVGTWDSGLYYENTFPSKFKGFCHNCAFWFEIMERFHNARRGRPFIVVNNGEALNDPGKSDLAMYELGTPPVSYEKNQAFLGLGGRAYICMWGNGEKMISNNIWFRGVIPARFKHPARFGIRTNMKLFRACGSNR